MLGEFFREAGVLVIVLAPLESLVTHGRLTVTGTIATLLIAGFLSRLAFGWDWSDDARLTDSVHDPGDDTGNLRPLAGAD